MKSGYFLASAVDALVRLDPIWTAQVPPAEHSGAAPPATVHHEAAQEHGGGGAPENPLGVHVWQWALFLALLSGSSMPLGASLGMKLRPEETTLAKWIAVGAGALLFAVAVELYGHAIHSYQAGYTEQLPIMILLVMSLLGALAFTKISRYIEGDEEDEEEEEEEKVECPNCCHMNDAENKFCTMCGETMPVSASRSPSVERLGGVIGEAGPSPKRGITASLNEEHHEQLLGHKKMKATAHTMGAMLRQLKEQERLKAQARWRHIREAVVKFGIVRALQKGANDRRSQQLESPRDDPTKSKGIMDAFAKAYQDSNKAGPSEAELDELRKRNRSAALSMFSMLLVDGIPEGILMGFMAAAGHLGLTFVLSLFIANFPEAFAGGVMMEVGGFSRIQILGAWGGLAVLVGTLAGLACWTLLWVYPDYTGGHHVPLDIQILVCLMEGLAGGAMISGISGVMLPEAFEKRDKAAGIVMSNGFLCLAGFLLSVTIKVLLD